jgi:hypothetical protein
MKKTKKYYRKITESLPQPKELAPHFLTYLILMTVISAVLLVAYLSFLGLKFAQANENRLQAEDSLSYWEDVILQRGILFFCNRG